jgi:hypothetical protein
MIGDKESKDIELNALAAMLRDLSKQAYFLFVFVKAEDTTTTADVLSREKGVHEKQV